MAGFFTFIHNCVWIFWFITINIKNPIKFQNEFQWITKHVFWQDYFLHMWLAPKAKHFEPIEHNCFCQMVKNLNPLPYNPFLQNFKTLKFCMAWFFIKFIQWTCTFINGGMFLLYKKFEISCMTWRIFFYSFFKNVV
jgi:hypothetical protein